MIFEDIIGQETVKNMLMRSINADKVSHSYIIEGAKGMGKKLVAYTFANYLVCENHTVCGSCSGCLKAKAGTHPDILTVLPDEGKKTIGTDNIREIIKKAMVKPYEADKKIIILPDCDGITTAAQNAMLKIIEEPPPYIVFLILIQNSNSLLETVRSRSIKLSMSLYSDTEIKKALGGADINPYILAYCEGNIGKAKELVFDEDFITLRDSFFEILPYLTAEKRYKVFEIADFFEKEKDNAELLLDFMLSFFRDVILIKCGNGNMLQNTDKSHLPQMFSDKITMAAAVEIVALILKTKQMLARNVNFSLAVVGLANGSWEVINGRNSRNTI